MSEPIILKKPKRRRKGEKKFRQLGLVLFTLLVMGLVIFVSYRYFFPQEEDFILDFFTYSSVTKRDFLDSISVSGVIKPEITLDIIAKIGAEVGEILVKEGSDVVEGQALIRLQSVELFESESKAQAELDQALAALAQLREDQEYEISSHQLKITELANKVTQAEANLGLQQLLYELGTIARLDLDKAENELTSSNQALHQAQHELTTLKRTQANAADKAAETIAQADQELREITEAIDNLVVSAPISGRILALNVGDKALVKKDQVLAVIADLATQIVELDISPAQAERFTLGSTADLTVGRSEYPATISYIAPQARQTTDGKSLVRVLLKPDTDPSDLRPFSTAAVNIHLGIYVDSLSLPRAPFLTSGQQMFVYRLDGNHASQVDVQFGMLQGNYIQILGGLEYGDQVITSSYDQYRHLEEINVLSEGGRKL